MEKLVGNREVELYFLERFLYYYYYKILFLAWFASSTHTCMHVPFLNSSSPAHSPTCSWPTGQHPVDLLESCHCKFNHVDSGLLSSMLDLCTSSWESISYPISCLAGFLHHRSEFSPHSSHVLLSTSHVLWVFFLMDHWNFHPVLSPLTGFSSKSYTGNAPLPPPLSSLWVPRMRSCNPSHRAGAASAQYYKEEGREWAGGARNLCLIRTSLPWAQQEGVP